MAASQLLADANKAYVDDDFEQALALYTKAIQAGSDSAEVYLFRSQAHLQLENYIDAAEDAGKAVELDPGSAKAHLKRGTALFHLEEYESAKAAFERGLALEPKSGQLTTWLNKCNAKLQEEGVDVQHGQPAAPAAPSRQQPQPPAPAPAAPKPDYKLAQEMKHHTIIEEEEVPDRTTAPKAAAPKAAAAAPAQATTTAAQVPEASHGNGTAAPAPQGPPPPKYRHQWFQTPTVVEVAVLAKNLTKEQVDVTIEEDACFVKLRSTAGETEYELRLDLANKIKPAECSYNLLKTKLEIILKKGEPTHWASLEKGGKDPANPGPAIKVPLKTKKDWNKLESEIKAEEKDEKLDGDAGLQKFFQSIYAGCDEDARRAMNKSMQESGGTVLSTNWKEVGSKKVEVQKS